MLMDARGRRSFRPSQSKRHIPAINFYSNAFRVARKFGHLLAPGEFVIHGVHGRALTCQCALHVRMMQERRSHG